MFPNEIYILFLSNLSYKDLLNLKLVSTLFRDIISYEIFKRRKKIILNHDDLFSWNFYDIPITKFNVFSEFLIITYYPKLFLNENVYKFEIKNLTMVNIDIKNIDSIQQCISLEFLNLINLKNLLIIPNLTNLINLKILKIENCDIRKLPKASNNSKIVIQNCKYF